MHDASLMTLLRPNTAGCHVLHRKFAVLNLLEGLHTCCAQGAVLWDRGW